MDYYLLSNYITKKSKKQQELSENYALLLSIVISCRSHIN